MSSSKEHVMSYIYDTFKRSFNLVGANTLELRERAYQLRYDTLCIQRSYPDISASDFPDGMEKDEFDERSCHMLIQFIPTQEYVGTVRLILPDMTDIEKLFPIEINTQIDPALCQLIKTNRSRVAEISRFLVSPSFNRRTEDLNNMLNRQRESTENVLSSPRHVTDQEKEKLSGRERRSGLNVYMVLMAAVVQMSVSNQIKYWWCAMDPALNRLVGFSGMNIMPIGPIVNYHGRRQPHLGQVCDVLQKLYNRNYGAWEVITDCGKNSYKEQCAGNFS